MSHVGENEGFALLHEFEFDATPVEIGAIPHGSRFENEGVLMIAEFAEGAEERAGASSIIVQVFRRGADDREASLELGARLERCCLRDAKLAGACRRKLVPVAGQTLGSGWGGELELSVGTREKVEALRDAMLSAFADSPVRVRVARRNGVVGAVPAEIELDAADPGSFGEILEGLCL